MVLLFSWDWRPVLCHLCAGELGLLLLRGQGSFDSAKENLKLTPKSVDFFFQIRTLPTGSEASTRLIEWKCKQDAVPILLGRRSRQFVS